MNRTWVLSAPAAMLLAGVSGLPFSSFTPSTGAAAQSADSFQCLPGRPCRDQATQLPLRGLLRPNAVVRSAPDASGTPLRVNPMPFTPFFVFNRQGVDFSNPAEPRGWYQVHDSTTLRAGEQPFGWVAAADLIEWKNAIVVSFAHPGTGSDQRGRVMMFADRERLRALATGANGAERARQALANIDSGDAAAIASDGVVMVEPRGVHLNIDSNFYILPVINFEIIPNGSREGRLLQVAAAVPQGEGRGATTLASAETRESVTRSPFAGGMQGLGKLKVDVKFVIDMTGSMQPYIDATRDAVTLAMDELLRGFGADSEGFLRFGLVGYTDAAEECSDCRFAGARNFTPDGPVERRRIAELLQAPQARAAGGGDWPEAVFDGVQAAAISPWTADALRFVILIGDASAKAARVDGTPVDEERVRAELDANQISLVSLHIRPTGPRVPPGPAADPPAAEEQFRVLARNPGVTEPTYFGFPLDPFASAAQNSQTFAVQVRAAVKGIAEELGRIRRGEALTGSAEAPPARPAASAGEPVRRAAAEVSRAALFEYLGREAKRPNDVTAWLADFDLTDRTRDALEVRILIERGELDDLYKTMRDLLASWTRANVTGSEFFTTLQTMTTGAAKDRLETMVTPDRAIRAGAAIRDLLPAWIMSLPYKSALQDMTFDDFGRLDANARVTWERDLAAKIASQERMLNNGDLWTQLSPRHSDLQRVYALPLTELP